MSHSPLKKAFFLPGDEGCLFFLLFEPARKSTTDAIILVPPFADEMNKSRRMVNLQAESFAELGFAVLIIDLFGTGDSSGEFCDASWEGWRKNVKEAYDWLQAQGFRAIHFWGIRLGCLLALDTVRTFDLSVVSFLFWQPVIAGDRFVTLLFRQRIAGEFGQQQSETVKILRQKSAEGVSLEIAGYLPSSEMLSTISNLRMVDMVPDSESFVIWLECSIGESEILPASQKVIDSWQNYQTRVHSACVIGNSFWNSVEIEEVPALIDQAREFYLEVLNDW